VWAHVGSAENLGLLETHSRDRHRAWPCWNTPLSIFVTIPKFPYRNHPLYVGDVWRTCFQPRKSPKASRTFWAILFPDRLADIERRIIFCQCMWYICIWNRPTIWNTQMHTFWLTVYCILNSVEIQHSSMCPLHCLRTDNNVDTNTAYSLRVFDGLNYAVSVLCQSTVRYKIQLCILYLNTWWTYFTKHCLRGQSVVALGRLACLSVAALEHLTCSSRRFRDVNWCL